MRAEIISIGTEILLGSILNTNARFIAQKLAENAIDTYHQVTVGDNIPRIVDAFQEAASRSDILITSGGLGPTEDDVTMQSVGKFLNCPLVFHKPTHIHIQRALTKRGYRMTALSDRQCLTPKKAFVFQNRRGTAPGVLSSFTHNNRKKWLLVLPGPPRELEPMFTDQALPFLKKQGLLKNEHFIVRSIKITGLLESQVAEKTTDLLKLKPPVTVGIYAKPGVVELKIMAKSSNKHEAIQKTTQIEKKIQKRFGNYVFGSGDETLADAVGSLLVRNKKTLATAESCTGGLLSHLITETPGSSNYFLGGLVSYSNTVKSNFLDVPAKTLKKHGAVSDIVARQMARGARERFGSDLGIGITGIAGPGGGSKKKPVGLVYIALSRRDRTVSKKYIFFGSRTEIKSRSAFKALDLLRLELLKK